MEAFAKRPKLIGKEEKRRHFVTAAALWVAAKNLPLSIDESDSFEAMIQTLDPTAKKIYNKEMKWKLKDIGNVMQASVKEKLKSVLYEFNYVLCCLNVIIILVDAFIENPITNFASWYIHATGVSKEKINSSNRNK